MKAFPLIMYSWTSQPWVLTIYEGLHQPSPVKATKFINIGTSIVFIIYSITGLFGYLTFLDNTNINIFKNDYSK